MRALAVLAVMVYHADPAWLPGGFLGVEVFFVLSGYLITTLLLTEHEASGRIDLRAFWLRRARRLLPALVVVLVGVTVVTAVFRTGAAGQLRGDLLAAGGYVTNWYQVWVGAGYTASGDFAPLRHLWSLAIEEQFYLVWPVVLWLLWRGRRKLPDGVLAWLLLNVSVAIIAVNAALTTSGPGNTCGTGPSGDWLVAGRCIDVADTLYLSTITRAPALVLGAAFALVWRPTSPGVTVAPRPGRVLDAIGVTGLIVLGLLSVDLRYMTPSGVDPFLFRGGLVLADLATIAVIAAIARHRTWTFRGRVNGWLRLVGARSYGWYLIHWPVYQLVRGVAGRGLSASEFLGSVALTAALAELSYRYVETPIRQRGLRGWWDDLMARRPRSASAQGPGIAVAGAVVASLAIVAIAPLTPNSLDQAFAAGRDEVTSIEQLLAGDGGRGATGSAASQSTVPPGPAQTAPPATSAPVEAAAAPTVGAGEPPPTSPSSVPSSPIPDPSNPSPVTAPATSPPTAPPPTAPPATAPPATAPPATAPPATGPPPIDRLAIGDSVMLGAAPQLVERGWVVDAEVGRQGADAVALVEVLAGSGRLGDEVMLHLGTNGPVSDATWDALLAPLANVERVILVTIRANRSWTNDNSQRIRERAGGNVVVVDWEVESQHCPGNCFESDGIHLRLAGREFYTDLVEQAATGTTPSAG